MMSLGTLIASVDQFRSHMDKREVWRWSFHGREARSEDNSSRWWARVAKL